ncbi:EAL domain-containing protein [Asticcacaulis sp.]|uniref:putative bifunctional diguanylate cyclase/phosphodiesterase n=1 Tax=Asticcacaulis sp. TaxID=1872648 RepID=UPI0026040417|nr:EAL domain-containing protein [Asticcacaulis sp.]
MLSLAERTGDLRRYAYRLLRRLKASHRQSEVDTAELRRQRAIALRPVVRGLCGVVGSYYIVIFISHFFYEKGMDLPIMAGLGGLTAVTCLSFFRWTRWTESVQRLEIVTLIVSLLMYTNVVVSQYLHFVPAKLIYFVLMTLVFATSAVSLRVVVPTSFLATGTMFVMAHHAGFPVLKQHIWVGIGGIVTALGMAGIMRSTIFRAVHARLVAEKHRHEAQILAHYDALTGLPNRRSFFTELDVALVGAKNGHAFDLGLIDLDGFKPVNDLYGHSVGDALLIEVGKRLRAVVGSRGVVARLGGDEFSLILNGQMPDDDLRRFGEDLCDTLRETYVLGGGVCANISGSVGFVHSDPDAQWNASQMLERADYALYYAKQNLRGAPVIFDRRHENEMQDFGAVDQTLRSSDLESELYIVFQPQIDLKAQRTVSFEALARWQSEKLGPVRPDIFIRAAERSGLISDITLILLRKALVAVRDWPNDMRVSFNLSARDLRSLPAIARICDTVQASGVDPKRIEFEITETAMLSDFDQALEALALLKGMGSRIALDDFGSGYSSFGYIHRLPVDKIKIDRSFVTQLLRHDSTVKIVKTLIDLCGNLSLDHVIEGVETAAELCRLEEIGARYIQGYYFSQPMRNEAINAYLDAESWREGLKKAG